MGYERHGQPGNAHFAALINQSILSVLVPRLHAGQDHLLLFKRHERCFRRQADFRQPRVIRVAVIRQPVHYVGRALLFFGFDQSRVLSDFRPHNYFSRNPLKELQAPRLFAYRALGLGDLYHVIKASFLHGVVAIERVFPELALFFEEFYLQLRNVVDGFPAVVFSPGSP